MICPKNQKEYCPKGSSFDKIANLCQTIVQCRLTKRYKLQRIQLSSERDGDDEESIIEALVTPNYFSDPSCPTLIIMLGKGESRAGILSTKQLVLSGAEVGSAEYFLQHAYNAGMAVLLLDPNARGPQSGMTCLEISRTNLFEEDKEATSSHRPIYILAHSAAGGYLWAKAKEGDDGAMKHEKMWLCQFLQSSHCLYVRNTATHHLDTFAKSKDRKLGDEIAHDVHWKRRFGTIRTVWAGTTEHSRIFWEGRHLIWDFFESRLSSKKAM
ncbi:MAG: hypothetical protein SGARI_005430 [Bacillariaceae sp.]